MPFERYLHYSPSRSSSDQASESSNRLSAGELAYPDLGAASTSARSDSYGYDHNIFSHNIPFQMPQLILGPTVPPGGGMEVLPAGIVNRPAIASNWLPNVSFRSFTDQSCFASHDHPLAQTSVMPPYQSNGVLVPGSSELSSKAQGDLTNPITFHTHHAEHDGSHTRTTFITPGIPVSVPFVLPPVGSLPVYSTSGFDILSLLARVATRPHPKIALGPVDMTCSFVVVDVRRYDHPIVYCSPTFCELTGYKEDEIIGRNCRFLQAPGGQVTKGAPRLHTSQDTVAHLRKSLVADKECQVSLVNYRKNGDAFINLLTVIPVPGGANNAPHEADDVVYQIGFQVDLTAQPNAILQKLRDGSYMVDYSSHISYPPLQTKGWGAASSATAGVSKQFRTLLSRPDFVQSIPLSTETTTLSLAPEERNDPYDGNRLLSLLLLETSPDMILVLSLKGTFLYVSPSVRRVLGYDPEDLVGKGITDFCHEADKVPLIRELKESSSGPTATQVPPDTVPPTSYSPKPDSIALQPQATSKSASPQSGPRNVDLLFRMLTKCGRYAWTECGGRLFVEPGKGRKAIILSGRVRSIPSLRWQALADVGGIPSRGVDPPRERECWLLLSRGGSFLYAGASVRDVLGWGVAEVIGRSILEFVGGDDPQQGRVAMEEALRQAFAKPTDALPSDRGLSCRLKKKDHSEVLVDIVLYRPADNTSADSAPGPLVCQISLALHAQLAEVVHPLHEDVFAELDTARGSGWQYELQQLKHANQRLSEQVHAFEAKLVEKQARASYLQHVGQKSTGTANAWANHLMSHPVPPSLKRSWEGNLIDTIGRT